MCAGVKVQFQMSGYPLRYANGVGNLLGSQGRDEVGRAAHVKMLEHS
jgi:hypothetical protein